MKVRAKFNKGVTEVKLLADHPMESGQRKDSNGNVIPGHYITILKAVHKDKVVLNAYLGPAVSKDPYIKFSFKGGASGDKLFLDWIDNQNKTATAEVDIS